MRMGVYSGITSSTMKALGRANTMDRYTAEKLADAAKNHPEMIPLDRKELIAVLEQAHVPESTMFHAALPENSQTFEGDRSFHRFSLRRILRNRHARPYRPNPIKHVYERAIYLAGGYSSYSMARKIRADRKIREMLARNDNPLALLGKLETYDWGNPDKTLYIVTRPVLIVADTTDAEKMLDWERAHTAYEKEVGLFGWRKRTRREEYLALKSGGEHA